MVSMIVLKAVVMQQIILDDGITGFKDDSQSGKVHCLACKETSSDGNGSWMLKGSAQKHTLGASHLSAVVAATESRRQATESAHHLQQPYYNSPDVYINPSTAVATPEPHIGIFDAAADNDIPDFLDDDGEFASSSPPIPIGIFPITLEDPSAKQERLRRQVEILVMQAEQDDEFGGDGSKNDSTITNIVEQFRLLGTSSDCPPFLTVHLYIFCRPG